MTAEDVGTALGIGLLLGGAIVGFLVAQVVRAIRA